MFTSKAKKLTDLSQVFLEPANATHRQYEALRAFFVDGTPQRRGRPPLRLHPGQLPRPRPPIPPESSTRLLPDPGQGAPVRTQDRSPPGTRHRPAETEPLHLRHQPQPGPPRASAQPGRRRTDPQGRRVRSLAAPGRRRTPARLAADHGRCRRCPTTRPEPAVLPDQIRRPVPLPAHPGLDPPRPHPPGRRASPDRR